MKFLGPQVANKVHKFSTFNQTPKYYIMDTWGMVISSTKAQNLTLYANLRIKR